MLVETTSVSGYLRLSILAGLRRIRRSSLRFGVETRAIESWLETISLAMQSNHKVALEISESAGLIKGYGDTHQRGMKSYTLIMEQLVKPAVSNNDFTDQLAMQISAARSAALADPDGQTLKATLENAA